MVKMNRFHESIVETREGEYLIRGTLTKDIPFLCKTQSGCYVTPIWSDKEEIIGHEKGYAYQEGKIAEIPVTKAASFTYARFPSIAINGKDGTTFLPFIAFGLDAINLIRNKGTWEDVCKGTQIVCLAEKAVLTFDGKSYDVYKLREIISLRQSIDKTQELMGG